MKLTAKTENIRTLAAALGVDEGKAEDLLDISILITCRTGDRLGNVFADELRLLLERTVKTVGTDNSDHICPSMEIIVGNCTACTEAKLLFVSLQGDVAIISDRKGEQNTAASEVQHPVFLLLSACYAAAKAVGSLLSGFFPYRVDDPLVLDFKAMFADDLEILHDPLVFQSTYLAGAGAVGNAFIYALRYFDVDGTMNVVDPKQVTEGNLNRCMFFTKKDLGQPKAEQLSVNASLFFNKLKLVARNQDLRDLSERNDGPWLEKLIVTVDSRRVRRSLQSEIPREVYDASTTGIQEAVLHFNSLPSHGKACLSCIYVEEEAELSHEQHVADVLGVSVDKVHQNLIDRDAANTIIRKYPEIIPDTIIGTAYDTLFKQMCGQGKLQATADKQVLAPFAFVSVLTGTMLAIEVVRRMKNGQVSEPFNYWRLSPYASPVLRGRASRGKVEQCEFCGNSWLSAATEKLWGSQEVLDQQENEFISEVIC